MRRLVHLIGPGERAWFRRCRRAWDLGSPNRQNLEPQSEFFELQRAVRYALSVWYFPGMWAWPRAIVLPRALQAFDKDVARGQGQGETVERARAMLERYFAWAPTVDAFSPVRVESDFEASVPDIRNPGQDLADGEGRPVRYIDRVQLLVVDSTDSYWIVEHRLVDDDWADRDELLLAEPPVAAAWGWERFYLGMAIAGTVHNELRLSAEEEGDDLFRRTWIPRSRAEVASVGDRLSAQAFDMLDPDLALYPSPSPEHCGPCLYRAPCLAMNEGNDPAPILAAAYQQRAFDRPEEGRLGGGSWSMNRGAAPPPQWRKPPP